MGASYSVTLKLLASIIALTTITFANAQQLPSGIYVNETQSSEGINAAIKANVDDTPFFFRKLVRKALLEVSPAYKRVAIEQTTNEIVVTFDAGKPFRMPADGSATQWINAEGDVYDVSAAWQDGKLVQTIKSKKGGGVNVLHFSPDRQSLTLNRTITGERLSSPIRYELTFRRQ